ncbi:MAG: ATP-NAD kinase family protein [Moraxellaceae bacterium]|nr:ATP-NAD kinase family protein [Moraxellaceae bacterium]
MFPVKVVSEKFRLGLLVNPLAGLGGTVALKGSDGVAAEALARGAVAQAVARTRLVLAALLPWRDALLILTASGEMGAVLAEELGFIVETVHEAAVPSSAADTEAAAAALKAAGVDLLLFAGGDGTARDICRAVGLSLPVLGIPAGVKMHSGVFAVTPRAAANMVQLLLQGEMVLVDNAEVRDIDEAALRAGKVQARHFGELRVPSEGRYLQQVKCNGPEVEALVLQEIAADVVERMQEEGGLWLIGPGTTPAAVMAALGLPDTLLGIDVVRDGVLVATDADAVTLECLVAEALAQSQPCRLVISATGGQGMLLGRGNQQLTPVVLRAVGRSGLVVVATQEKLSALGGRPLLMDVPDAALEAELTGLVEVVSGYRHHLLYRLAAEG